MAEIKYAKIENGEVIKYPYSIEDLRIDNPNAPTTEIICNISKLKSHICPAISHGKPPNKYSLTISVVAKPINIANKNDNLLFLLLINIKNAQGIKKIAYKRLKPKSTKDGKNQPDKIYWLE